MPPHAAGGPSRADAGGVSRPSPHVVVPVYQNAATVRSVVTGALALGLPVVVVDDGSTDGSGDAVADLPVERVRHSRNRGKGAALLSGAERVKQRGGTHVVSLDADGQFSPDEVPALLAETGRRPEAIVCGVRRFEGSGAPRGSTFGRRFSNFWVRAISGARVDDSQSGLRVYPLHTLLELGLRRMRYDLEVEVLVRAAWSGVEIVGVPVAVTYAPAAGRVSHFRPFRDNLRISRTYAILCTKAMLLLWPPRVARKGSTSGGVERLSLARHPRGTVRALLRHETSPARIAASAALGVLIGALPIPGLHPLALTAACAALGVHRLAAFAAARLCAPPLVPALFLAVGYHARHGSRSSGAQGLVDLALERLLDYATGIALLAFPLAVLGGLLMFAAARRAGDSVDAGAGRSTGRGRVAAYGPRWGIRFVVSILRRFGVLPAYAFLGFVVPFYFVRPAVRRSMRPYLARRFPDAGPVRRQVHGFRLLMEFARSLVDQAAVSAVGPGIFEAYVPDQPRHVRTFSGETGAVFLLSHVGAWAIATHYLDVHLDLPHKTFYILMHRDPKDHAMWPGGIAQGAGRLEVIEPTSAFGGLVEAGSALLKGHVVGMMGDRHWGGRSVAAPFLGATARVPVTPYRLARPSGAAVLAVVSHRDGLRRYRVEIHNLSERVGPGATPEQLAAAYLSCLERFLERHPYLWFNFYDFWSAEEPAASGATHAE